MFEFRIQFDAPPTGVTTPVGRVTTANAAPDLKAVVDHAAAVQTVDKVLLKVSEIERVTQQRIARWNQQVIALATQIAQAVVRMDDDFVQERVCQYVAAALDQLPDVHPEAIVVHPSCASSVRDWIQQSPHGELTVREDPSITPGDCVVESDASSVAAMLDAHLEAITRRFGETSR
ncbi:MAG: FliH/SctL family protein [Planctomycetota bacterium]